MKGKRKATKNDSELNATQPPVKRIRQTVASSTSSMTTDHQRTSIAELVAGYAFFGYIEPNRTDDEYLASILMPLFQSVYEDSTWQDALNEEYTRKKFCFAAIKANTKLAEECRRSMKTKDWKPVFGEGSSV
jgi:hypothetical protein